MILPTALAIALVAGSQTSPELCVGFDNRIASDMRIHESDLTRSAAVEALDRLKGMIERGSLGGEFKLGALNQSKIIHGHILLRQAQAAPLLRTSHASNTGGVATSGLAMSQDALRLSWPPRRC